jgi:hypothetical protein
VRIHVGREVESIRVTVETKQERDGRPRGGVSVSGSGEIRGGLRARSGVGMEGRRSRINERRIGCHSIPILSHVYVHRRAIYYKEGVGGNAREGPSQFVGISFGCRVG